MDDAVKIWGIFKLLLNDFKIPELQFAFWRNLQDNYEDPFISARLFVLLFSSSWYKYWRKMQIFNMKFKRFKIFYF